MYSFEGDFRRKPVQSLRGASKKEEKDALITRTQADRRRREECRQRSQSAIQIQSFYRGAKAREKQKATVRAQFDVQRSSLQKRGQATDDTHVLSHLTTRLCFFYDERVDEDRLAWVGQLLVRHNVEMTAQICDSKTPALYQIKRLLWLCCRQLESSTRSQFPVAVPMRMLEVYTDVGMYTACTSSESAARDTVHDILHFLISKGYYRCMRTLVQEKIPPSLERTLLPPTPIAGSILDLIKKPLHFVTQSHSGHFRNEVLQSLCQELFCSAYSEQTREFVLPALAYGWNQFPFIDLLHALLPTADAPQQNGSSNPRPESEGQAVAGALPVEPTPWLLCAVLMLCEKHLGQLSRHDLQMYLLLLHRLVPGLWPPKARRNLTMQEDSDSEDDYMEVDAPAGAGGSQAEVRQECLRLLDQPQHVRGLVQTISRDPDPAVLSAVCTVCHALMAHNKLLIHRTRLLYSLAFNPVFLRHLWMTCISVSVRTVTGSQTPLLQMLTRGLQMRASDIDRIVPLVSVFCSLFSHSLLSLHDAEFYGDDPSSKSFMPFRVSELVPMSQWLRDACLGIIELAHPDTRPTIKDDYKKAFRSVGVLQNELTTEDLDRQRETWAYLFKVITQLVRQLYSRDSRRQFCPEDHWLARQANIQSDKLSHLYRAPTNVFVRRPFASLSALNPRKMLEEEGPPLSTVEVRNLTILTEVPFVVAFEERVKIFQHLVRQDHLENQGDMPYLMSDRMISVMIRRTYLYEDAFEKLSPENEPNLKKKVQVQLVNFAGLDEAGIDGGGLFREFVSELLKTAFNPNRGFFRYTTDKLLYPNPQSRLLVSNFTAHYYFLGRILGKAIYENMLVELPFASFFLSKILSRHRGDVDIHHLASLDPEMYRNLLFLKNYDGDVGELGLDFTVVNNDLGEAQIEELKPGGRDIAVDNLNRIEYIHLMADYRLNRQIRTHCSAFREGLADVINIDWLRMFDHNEVQVLISGAEVPIDIDDLRRHTNYTGGYTEDHHVIQNFWRAVAAFSDTQKRQLLKFVTSCSRPPLLGFKELYPAFCVHHGGLDQERLPSASTCMNLLKLPQFKEEKMLHDKLLYAIESGTGFELS